MKQYHRAIFFTKSPLAGFYRFKDVFQIFPASLENMPEPYAYQHFHFPNILEYWTSDDEHVTVPNDIEGLEELHTMSARMTRKETQILSLLSAFSNNIFFRYPAGEGIWGIPLPKGISDEELNNSGSVWCFQMYFFPDLPRQLATDGFTENLQHPIETKEYYEFYTRYPNLDSDKNEPIVLPDVINELFSAYYSLDQEIQIIIDYAVSYTVSAVSLYHTNKTLSLLSSFTSLESLVNLEYKSQAVEYCETCGQPKFKVSAKFRDFLLKYIGNTSGNKKKFNQYYSLRSKVVHTGQQLATEKLFAEVSDNVRDKELMTRTEILQLGKMALTSWLLNN